MSEDTALVSEDTALVSENTVLVFEDTALVAIPFRVCKLAKNDPNFSVRRIKASFSEVGQFPFGFASWRKGDPRLPFGSGAIPFRETLGVHRECTRSAPGIHQECTGVLGTFLAFLSSALLFMRWQREGASLGTSWSSQQCSAVHDMAT